MKTAKLYTASKTAFFNEYENTIRTLHDKIDQLTRRSEEIEDLYFDLIRKNASIKFRADPPSCWIYDVRMPNLMFSGLHQLQENHPPPRRWVGPNGVLKGHLALPRHVQYTFRIFVVDFVDRNCEKSFALKIDGHVHGWLAVDQQVYTAVTVEAPAESDLRFEVGVDPRTLPDGADLSFSFSRIEIRRLDHQAEELAAGELADAIWR